MYPGAEQVPSTRQEKNKKRAIMSRRSTQETQNRLSKGGSIRLTPSDIAHLCCPNGKSQHIVWDSAIPGLGVRVSKTGRKSFVLKKTFTVNGTRKDFKTNLGNCLTLSIDEARKKSIDIISQTEATGLTPAEAQAIEERKAEQARKHAEKLANEKQREQQNLQKYTLGALCIAYVNHLKFSGKVSHAQVKSQLDVHVFVAHPELADKPAAHITRKDIATILETMLTKGIRASVSRVRAYLVTAFNLAIQVDGDIVARRHFSGFEIENNPALHTAARSLRRLCGVGNRVLDITELQNYYRALLELPEGPAKNTLLMSLLLGGQRMTQLIRTQRSDLDLQAGVITLQDGKGNRDRPRLHALPLVGPALELARQLDAQAAKAHSEYLFYSEVKPQQPVINDFVSRTGNKLANTLLEQGKVRSKFTVADIRRTIETMLARERVPMEVRAQLQSHGLSGVQFRHYDRHDYMQEKAEALKVLQRFLVAR